MSKMTKKQRADKKKGLGWGHRNRQSSPHMFLTERWLVTAPEVSPKAYLSEDKALRAAALLAVRIGVSVGIDHQRENNGVWESVND